jgi:hypothetical protein
MQVPAGPRGTTQYYAVARNSPKPPPRAHRLGGLPQGRPRAERVRPGPRRTMAHFAGPRRASQSPRALGLARALSEPPRATPNRVGLRRPSQATQDRAGCRGISPAPAIRRLHRTQGRLRAFSAPRRSRRLSPSYLDPRGATQGHPGTPGATPGHTGPLRAMQDFAGPRTLPQTVV